MIVNTTSDNTWREAIRGRIVPNMEIKDVLADLLAKRKMNANSLALAIGKPQQPTIHRILTGESENPRAVTLRPIAKYFGVSLPQLRGEVPLDAFSAAGMVTENSGQIRQLSAKEEIVLELFQGLFSHQQREVILELHARFEYAQFLRRDMGVKELNPIGDKRMENILGEAFPPKDAPPPMKLPAKAPGRPPGAPLDDYSDLGGANS